MPWDEHAWVADLRDSKTLTVDRRRALAVQIREAARAVGVGWVTADEIDAIGLAPANELAMLRAVRDLPLAPDFLLIDAFQLRTSAVRQRGIIHGDSRSHSIAAASIVAKVTRDDWMVRLARRHRGYGFERHKGYGVASHRAALGERGPSAIHRLSFQPVTEAIR
jgi:ribonuclease HII